MFSRGNSFWVDRRKMRCDSEVLEIKKTETVITEKERELKRRLDQKLEYKGSQIFFLNQSDGTLKH